MSKKKNKLNKSRKNISNKKTISSSKMKAAIFFTLFSVACFIFILISGILNYFDNRNIDVAYYNIPENVISAISKSLKNKSEFVKEKILTDDDISKINSVSRKYDFMFTQNNAQSSLFSKNAIPISENTLNVIPSSIRNVSKVENNLLYLPVLLDHYEVAFYRTYRNDASLQLPETFGQFESYLRKIKQYAVYPIICAGKTDTTLLAFVSAFVESIAGSNQYYALVDKLSKSSSIEDVLNFELSENVTFASVLDIIKNWQAEGLIHPQWYYATESDIKNFMSEYVLGCVFMSLSEHRKQEFVLIKYYDSMRFPILSNDTPHALIAPSVVGILFDNYENNSTLFNSLVLPEEQLYLSQETRLAPVASRSEAIDSQADDVRFWAASCEAGPVQDIASCAFSSKDDIANFAEEIRNYLKK